MRVSGVTEKDEIMYNDFLLTFGYCFKFVLIVLNILEFNFHYNNQLSTILIY